ncbi:MAG: hypothetical protein M3N08_02040, partial [Pseudomonadota bacterium]|nr:hypothetical protein [Pseudomonadota bacterium]
SRSTGLVFETDHGIQSVHDNGKETICFGGLTAAEGVQLMDYYGFVAPEPDRAKAEDLRELLRFAREDMGIGNISAGETRKIQEYEPELVSADSKHYGVFVERDRGQRFALLAEGGGVFAGSRGAPQTFQDKLVIVKSGTDAWAVPPESFVSMYKHPYGHDIKIEELPAFVVNDKTGPEPKSPLAWHQFVRGIYKKREEAAQAFMTRSDLPPLKAREEFFTHLMPLAIRTRELVKAAPAELRANDPQRDARTYMAWHALIFSTPDPVVSPRHDFADKLAAFSVEAFFDRVIAGIEPGFGPKAVTHPRRPVDRNRPRPRTKDH